MNNLILWYDKIDSMNLNDGTRFIRSNSVLLPKLQRYNISYCNKQIGEHFNTDDFNMYVIELLDVESSDNFFISLKCNIAFLKKVKVVFYYPREGFELGKWYIDINNFCEANNLDAFFVYADIDIEAKAARDYIKPIYIDHFISDYYDTITELGLSQTSIKTNTIKTKDFLCYNGKSRPMRLMLISDLYKHNLDNNYISCTGGGTDLDIAGAIDFFRYRNKSSDYFEHFIQTRLPIYLDKGTNDFGMVIENSINYSHYEDTYFSVVTETLTSPRFITEKTYKAIFIGHPFIVLGPCGLLKYLRDLGFYTFEEFFDESYDAEEDIAARYNMVLNNIIDFCKLPQKEKQSKFESVKSKLEYNKKHYILLAQENRLEQVLERIYVG